MSIGENNAGLTRNTEVRHLPISQQSRLSEILNVDDSWILLMENIPKNLADVHRSDIDFSKIDRKYTATHVRLIIEESKQQSTLPTRILLDEWGTSGRKRATIYDLLQCLIQTKLYRAADFVATELLNEPAPQRSANGSCARYPILFDDIDSDTSISDHEVAEHLITNSNELEMNVCALEISSKTENSDSDQSHFTDSDPLSSNSNSQLGDSHKSNDESRKFNSNDPFLLPNLSMFDGLELNNMKKSQCHSGLSLRFNDECNSDDSNYIPDFTSLSSSLHRLDVSIKSNNESKKYNSDGSNFMPKFTSLNGSMHHLNSHLNGLKKANDESKKCNSDDSNFIPNFTL